jgi:23S rRNA (pseudouridine1915-N3)-methyltransferase
MLGNNEEQTSFVIGGPKGINSKVKENCNQIIALSLMTFTHEMAQLFLLEQLYRAFTIFQNIKYHK